MIESTVVAQLKNTVMLQTLKTILTISRRSDCPAPVPFTAGSFRRVNMRKGLGRTYCVQGDTAYIDAAFAMAAESENGAIVQTSTCEGGHIHGILAFR